MMHEHTTSESPEWKQARRAAFIQEALATFTQRPVALLSFEEVSEKLKLSTTQYLGLQDVPLHQIAGSVGRYTDFNRAFLPRKDHLRERWQGIAQLARSGGALPPVELYKAGLVYFVRDGNHRVSVARQRSMASIEAHVWEFETPIPLEPDSNVDDLLCQAALSAFQERTGIERLRADVQIRLTQPDGYDELLAEIQTCQQIFSEVDRRDVPFDEAVDLWCDIRYLPVVALMREQYALADFPGRTEADLYLWLRRNRRELEARYEQHVLMEEAADDLTRRYGDNPLPVRQVKRAASWLAALGSRAARWAAAFRGSSRNRDKKDRTH
jgi:hypothetical protein